MPTARDSGRFVWARVGVHAPLIAVILVVGLFASLRSPLFLTEANLVEIFRATSTYLVIACPVTLLMIAGGLDFSVGATFSVGAVAACGLMTTGLPWPLAVVGGIAAGGVTGLVGGGLVVGLGVTAIIATLAVYFVATGLINVLVKGLIAPLPDGFLNIVQHEVLGLPLLVWYAAAVAVVFWVLLEKLPFGYAVRAIGGERTAARASGIRVRRIELTLYALCGAVAAFAGILYAARTSAGQPDAGGFTVTLQVITAVLVGGVSLSGGVGSIGGVVLGSLLFGEVENALGVTGLDQVWSNVFIGVVLAASVSLDGVRRRRRFQAGDLVPASGALPSVSRDELVRVMAGRSREEAERVAAAISSERRRIERDLHDGAQQQLVNASLSVELAALQLKEAGADHVADLLTTSLERLDAARTELRDLSRGIYPVALSEQGLVPAVESLARSNDALSIHLTAEAVPRMAEELELTAYFAVAEALTNVLKYAGTTDVRITIGCEETELHVTVADTGSGGADESRGTGLLGIRERVEAVGGRLSMISPPREGTTLLVCLPVRSPTA